MSPDIFLKLDTIKGESKDSKHKGEIDISSFTFGLSNGGSWAAGGGGGAGKVGRLFDKVIDAVSSKM